MFETNRNPGGIRKLDLGVRLEAIATRVEAIASRFKAHSVHVYGTTENDPTNGISRSSSQQGVEGVACPKRPNASSP